MLNEFFLYVLEDLHTTQGPARPKDTSGAGALGAPHPSAPAPRQTPVARWGGARSATPNRRAEAPVVSDDEEGADLISPANQTSPTLELETLGGSRNGDA